jgi:aldehyde dehydrogenase (NAD+)
MTSSHQVRINEVFSQLGCKASITAADGLKVISPMDGAVLATLEQDSGESLNQKIISTRIMQTRWDNERRDQRVALVESLSSHIRQYREQLSLCIHLEGGKTLKEAGGEVDSSADVLLKTIKNTTLAELSGMVRCKERSPVGVVGLITSFNFPLAVANWTLAPAMLAGNSVAWKPSEKTPLTALAFKAVFDKAALDYNGLLEIIIGGREMGHGLVAHEQVDMISATGSVAMGKGIKTALAAKKNNAIAPILELGGNNGVIISNKIAPSHLEFALSSILNSFLGTTGQRCTNTRRLIIHRSLYDKAVHILTSKIVDFVWDDFGYNALIDADTFARFEKAKQQALAEGGKIVMGKRLKAEEYPNGYYVEPALALMPKHSAIMEEETFAPLLFIAPYDGDIVEAIRLVNQPANAGLVNGIYTQSQKEANFFAKHNDAGHSLINSPKGTGTPAFDMGFGGNKASGEGEILNASDPLAAFTRHDRYTRIAQNKDIVMDQY